MKPKCEKCKKATATIQLLTHKVVEAFRIIDEESGECLGTFDLPYDAPQKICKKCWKKYQ